MATSYAECATQIERIHLYWANYKKTGYVSQDAHVARREVSAHVGSEKGVEEIWETLYFLTTNSSAEYYPGLVRSYIAEANDVFSLTRMYIFLRFQARGEGFLPLVLDKLFSLQMSVDDRTYVLKIVTGYTISGYDFRRHVHSTLLRSLGMQ